MTVNSDRYVTMFRNFLQPMISEHGNGPLWFQQDGATAHTAKISRGVLGQLFPGRPVSLHGDIPWPARSRDLSPCDFFLWGHLKSEVFRGKPQTIEALKDAIRNSIAPIPQEMTLRAMRSFTLRLQQCIARRFGRYHLQNTQKMWVCSVNKWQT